MNLVCHREVPSDRDQCPRTYLKYLCTEEFQIPWVVYLTG